MTENNNSKPEKPPEPNRNDEKVGKTPEPLSTEKLKGLETPPVKG